LQNPPVLVAAVGDQVDAQKSFRATTVNQERKRERGEQCCEADEAQLQVKPAYVLVAM
jgi:hypothetical protein